MIRTKKNNYSILSAETSVCLTENLFGIKGIPDAILTADWHLRNTTPSCRKSVEFEAAQWKKVAFISELQRKYNIPILHSGDLFDIWNPAHDLVANTILRIPNEFYTIYGNHDLPQHNLLLGYKSAMQVLINSRKVKLLNGIHWNQNTDMKYSVILKNRKILIKHVMTYQGKKLYPGMKDMPAGGVLRNTTADLVLTGHNHQSFIEEHNGRLLVNPGCITRQESDQANFIPKVYLYYAYDNSVKEIELPYQKGVVEKADNIKVKEERDERISAFISKLNTQFDSSISFTKNIEIFLLSNEVPNEVTNWIQKALEN